MHAQHAHRGGPFSWLGRATARPIFWFRPWLDLMDLGKGRARTQPWRQVMARKAVVMEHDLCIKALVGHGLGKSARECNHGLAMASRTTMATEIWRRTLRFLLGFM